ncbi:DUF4221 family protein [Algoriphagus sp.]|uniref:DUF4221 family protein n=1 Tax=Algoriphagus sp. TaxID=1872435 RepID=UPI00391BB51F
MKTLYFLLFLSTLFSCGKETSENAESRNILENLTFSVDTIMVDAGEDFLNLAGGIFPFSLNEDKSQLWFFEKSPKRLVQVDLDQLKVLKKSIFEEEGPDGVGSYVSDLEIGPNGELYLKSNSAVVIFDPNGQKLQNLMFVPSGIDSILARNRHAIFDKSVFDFGTKKIYSHPSFADAGEYMLLILNPETQSATSLPVPKMKVVNDYSRTQTFEIGGRMATSFYSVGSDITLLPGEVILSNAAMSGIYRLNIQTEKLEFIDIQHQNFPNSMDIEIIQNPAGPEQMFENQKKILEHINYMELLWDDSRQLYFRLGTKTFMGDKPGPPSVEYYLFVYDQNFKVLGETKLEDVKGSLWSSFFKDGQLWSYVNVEDELGFAVMEFKF